MFRPSIARVRSGARRATGGSHRPLRLAQAATSSGRSPGTRCPHPSPTRAWGPRRPRPSPRLSFPTSDPSRHRSTPSPPTTASARRPGGSPTAARAHNCSPSAPPPTSTPTSSPCRWPTARLASWAALRAALGDPVAGRRHVIVPSFTFTATACAIAWAGFEAAVHRRRHRRLAARPVRALASPSRAGQSRRRRAGHLHLRYCAPRGRTRGVAGHVRRGGRAARRRLGRSVRRARRARSPGRL